MSEVIDQVKQRLVARGLTIVENVPIPDVDKQIVLLEAPQLEQARTIYAFANPVARVADPGRGGALFGRVLAVAPPAADGRDHRAGAGGERAAGAGAVDRPPAIHRRARRHGVRPGKLGVPRHAAGLSRARLAGAGWLGLLLVVVGWFTGSNASGSAVRTTLSGGLESVGAQPGRRAARRCRSGGSRIAGGSRVAVGVVGVVVLLWGNDVSVSRLGWSLLLVVVLPVAVVQILVGAGRGADRRPSAGQPTTPCMTEGRPKGASRSGGRTAPCWRRGGIEQGLVGQPGDPLGL